MHGNGYKPTSQAETRASMPFSTYTVAYVKPYEFARPLRISLSIFTFKLCEMRHGEREVASVCVVCCTVLVPYVMVLNASK
jgi:hypothetical protein